MATIAIIHGGGDSASSWELVAERLRERGHTPIALDLPCTDPAAGWEEYADAVAAALRDRGPAVLVAHSLGGFTAPLVCERVPVELLILVAAMIPTPGALASDYWSSAGYHVTTFDDETFYHDLSDEARTRAQRAERDQAATPMNQPWPLTSWPRVPTRYLLCQNDRVFDAARTRTLVRERLGIEADEIESGHCVNLARPTQLADRIHRYIHALRA